MSIGIVDYGCGNVASIQDALSDLGQSSFCADDTASLLRADALILPGVGAFSDAARLLRSRGLWDFVREIAGQKPLLGICLGMQLLFEKSFEGTPTAGLGLFGGAVEPLDAPGLKVPQMGWNELCPTPLGLTLPLLAGAADAYVYFVHSYAAKPADEPITLATCDYGGRVCACVGKGLLFGCQFHPEKSGRAGLTILQNFCDLAGKA